MRLGHRLSGNADGHLRVFLHGFLGDKSDWDPIISEFEKHHHCLAIDLPGHGESRIADSSPCGFVETASAIIELVDETGADTFSVIGYSMGGRLAFYLASVYAMRIDTLVLESASPGLRSDHERCARRGHDEALARKLESADLATFLDEWYRQPLFASLDREPDRLADLKAHRSGQDNHQLAEALRALGAGVQPSLWPEWENNHIPTLLVAGALDEKYEAIAREMGEICPAAEVAILPDCGHNVHFENPTVYTDCVLAFLNRFQE
jgi:2-succinyl-6-hydroxy-2,4-cyclohexadiene-1-carboxylate synthase